jgi:eukaryotic-like serine/threonine-protein kinase
VSDLDQGRIIDGKYELIEQVGEGGMATVWRAVMHGAAGWNRPVAVKKIKREFRALKNYINMFVEEARVGSELAHPNIVQVFDFCNDAEGSYYLIMEWVEGLDMAKFVRAFIDEGEPTSWELMAAIGVGALRGLAAAHERRRMDGSFAPVIHRDVSPQNILLAMNGTAKLTDFGLARARDRMYSLTAPGTVKGKLSFLAPEIALGGEAQPQSDLFSMGVVLWEALSGERLFHGADDIEVFKKIRACQVPSIDTRRPDLPPALTACVMQSLQKDPAHRQKNARDMAGELAEVLKISDTQDHHRQLGHVIQEARQRLGLLGSIALTHKTEDPAQVEVQSVEIEFSAVTRDLVNPKEKK